MSTGEYTKRYAVQRPVTADDGSGGQTVTWQTVTTIWAKVRAVTHREQAQASALQVLATYAVMTHFTSAIATTQRLVPSGWTGPTLEILGARDPDGRQRDLWLDCTEVI